MKKVLSTDDKNDIRLDVKIETPGPETFPSIITSI